MPLHHVPELDVLGHLLDTVISFVSSRPSAQLDGTLWKRKSILGARFFVICAINVPAADIGDTYKLN